MIRLVRSNGQNILHGILLCIFLLGISCVTLAEKEAEMNPTYQMLDKVAMDRVWSGHPVGFFLLTEGERQYVAYYDAERRMAVAQRTLGEEEWTIRILDSRLGWDSHNYVTLALDREGFLHVSGNMHGDDLVYFRSSEPYAVDSLEAVHRMTGELESVVTYPVFLKGPKGELIFNYRDGGSGRGSQIYNVYDETSKSWSRLTDKPFSDGEGERNAYFEGPVLGPDGFFHLTWIWRESPDCSTNHDLSYARSRDMVHWETAQGRPIDLPLRLSTPGVIVDPVPVGAGMLNGNGKIGFDSQDRVIVTYHKFDAEGKTQMYNARLEGGEWAIYQTSDWDYRWDFQGTGTIRLEIYLSPVEVDGGRLLQTFKHRREPSGRYLLDEETLQPRRLLPLKGWPEEILQVRSEFPEIQVHRRLDAGEASGEEKYLLRWETLPKNRDQPRDQPWPEPSLLEVYKVR